MRRWLIAVVWVAWLLITARAGYAPLRPGDRSDDRATRVSVWADVITLASMLGAVGAAAVPVTAFPGDGWRIFAVGSAIVLLGLGLRQWAAVTLGRHFTRSVAIRRGHRIVTAGPYRLLRHPGYLGALVSLVGLALTLGNWLSLAVLVLGFFLGHLPRMSAEEEVLVAHFGEPYREFQRTHRRLLPGIW